MCKIIYLARREIIYEMFKVVSLVFLVSRYVHLCRCDILVKVLAYPSTNLRKLSPLSANLTKWRNTLKQFVGKSRRIV